MNWNNVACIAKLAAVLVVCGCSGTDGGSEDSGSGNGSSTQENPAPACSKSEAQSDRSWPKVLVGSWARSIDGPTILRAVGACEEPGYTYPCEKWHVQGDAQREASWERPWILVVDGVNGTSILQLVDVDSDRVMVRDLGDDVTGWPRWEDYEQRTGK